MHKNPKDSLKYSGELLLGGGWGKHDIESKQQFEQKW